MTDSSESEQLVEFMKISHAGQADLHLRTNPTIIKLDSVETLMEVAARARPWQRMRRKRLQELARWMTFAVEVPARASVHFLISVSLLNRYYRSLFEATILDESIFADDWEPGDPLSEGRISFIAELFAHSGQLLAQSSTEEQFVGSMDLLRPEISQELYATAAHSDHIVATHLQNCEAMRRALTYCHAYRAVGAANEKDLGLKEISEQDVDSWVAQAEQMFSTDFDRGQEAIDALK